jgi:hypothetical protein
MRITCQPPHRLCTTRTAAAPTNNQTVRTIWKRLVLSIWNPWKSAKHESARATYNKAISQGHAPHACRAPKLQHHVLSAQFASGETDHAYVRLVYRLTLGDRCGIVNGGYRGQEAVCVAEPPRHPATCRHIRPSRSMHTDRAPDRPGFTAT